MLQGWVVIAVALGYIGLLFVVASYGDRARRFRPEGRSRHLIYPLSLAIYCTSWTFFGSVGLATRTGFEFLTIYVGPIIMIGLCYPFIMRVVRLAKAQNITSIADFTAARYGKSQAVAATVALIAIISTIPYIALQLKAVSGSLGTIIGDVRPDIAANMPVVGDIALFVALSMAAFAVLFGTRHIDATEHQDGLMLAVATESLVKLIAFLAVGVFVTFWMFDGPAALFTQAMQQADTAAILNRDYPFGTIAAMTLLSLFAILLLPRQFHVTVVENHDEREVKRAAWLFPLYLAADQPVRAADRARRHAHVPRRQRRQRHVRAGAAAVGQVGAADAGRLRRRPVGRDRDGDRGIGRARDHGVERHRRAADAQAPRAADHRGRRRRPHAADGAARGDRRHPAAGVPLLPLGRRRAARLDRAAVVRRHRAARAGVLRRAVLEARDRARRHGRHDDRHRDVGLYAAAAELRRCRASSPSRC